MINSKNSYSDEAKVGFFTLIGLTFIICLTIFFVKNLFHEKGKEYSLIFSHLDGLQSSSIVKYAGGIPVGNIKSILPFKNKIKIIVNISAKYAISNKTEFRISSDSMLGEKYINISKIFDDTTPEQFLPEGSTILGTENMGLDRIVKEVSDLAEKVSKMMIPISKMVVEVTDSGDLIKSIHSLSRILKDTSSIVGENRYALRSTINSIAKISQEIEGGKGALGVLLNDKNFANDVRDSMASIKEIISKIENSSILRTKKETKLSFLD